MIALYDQMGNRAMPLVDGNPFYGTGSDATFTLDLVSGQRRRTVLQDVANFARLVNGLENIDFAMSMANPEDVPLDDIYVHVFAEMVRKYHPLWINIHVNHPKEITPELAAACDRMADAGVPLGNQAVLLAGVNDSVHIQRQLVQELVMMRVRPYYLYQCDLVEGAGHFRTTVSKGIEIIEGLRGHTSGYAVPQYVIDAPGGGGKIPISPDYLITQAPGRVVLRNFEGYITTYTEPLDYDPTAIRHLEAQVARRPEPGQEGVSALLEGRKMDIRPEGFDQTRRRGREGEHRLSADAAKWRPYGVGDEEQPAESVVVEDKPPEPAAQEKPAEPAKEIEAA